MSRLIISDNPGVFDKCVKLTQNAGLLKFNKLSGPGINVAVFEKRQVFFGNVYTVTEDEFIAGTGTLLYRGKKGTDALKLLLEEFDGNILKVKKECLGIYSLVIKKNAETFVFGDYYGLYDLYYMQHEYYCVGNNLSTLAVANGIATINTDILMSQCIGSGHFDSPATLFRGIGRLRGCEYIRIVLGKLLIEEIPADAYIIRYEFESEEKAIQDILGILDQATARIRDNFADISVNMTGGFDSRSVLAAFYNTGPDVRILYGRGGKHNPITCEEDRRVVESISRKFKLPLYYMNWENNSVSGREYLERRRAFFRKYGFINIYFASDTIRMEYEGKISPYPEFMEFGYFLEAFRLREWAEDLHKDYFTVRAFVDDYLFRIEKDGAIGWNIASLKSMMEKDIRVWMKRMGISENNGVVSMDHFEALRWGAARFADSRMAFFVNEFTYSFPLYGIPQIQSIILSLPAGVIMNGSFQIKFLNAINPAFVTGLMLFSHRRLHKITKSGKKKRVFTFKNTGDFILGKIPFLALSLKTLYRHFMYRSYSNWEDSCKKDLEQINISLLDTKDIKNYNVFHNYNYFLAGYSELLRMLK